VASGDVDGDGFFEIVATPGPSPLFGAHVRGFNHDGVSITPLPGCSYFAFDPARARFGARAFVGADLDADGHDDLLVAGGPDPAMDTELRLYRFDGGVATWLTLDAFPAGWTYGADIAAGWYL
jgi:hypothetical protein